MQDSDKVLKYSHFGYGYLTCNGSGKQMNKDSHTLNNFSSSIDKVSFKRNSMSLGLVLLEKLFRQTQRSDVMSADMCQ